MKKYRYLLFDLDGTLTYSHPGIYASIRYALEDAGRGEPTERQLRSCVGPPLVYSFRHIFGMTEEETNRAVVKYRERYSEKGLFENAPVPGAKEILESLKSAGYVSAIATSKPKIFAERIADQFGFTPFLETVAGSGTDGSFSHQGVGDSRSHAAFKGRERALLDARGPQTGRGRRAGVRYRFRGLFGRVCGAGGAGSGSAGVFILRFRGVEGAALPLTAFAEPDDFSADGSVCCFLSMKM